MDKLQWEYWIVNLPYSVRYRLASLTELWCISERKQNHLGFPLITKPIALVIVSQDYSRIPRSTTFTFITSGNMGILSWLSWNSKHHGRGWTITSDFSAGDMNYYAPNSNLCRYLCIYAWDAAAHVEYYQVFFVFVRMAHILSSNARKGVYVYEKRGTNAVIHGQAYWICHSHDWAPNESSGFPSVLPE
jgi:hypothetical protein